MNTYINELIQYGLKTGLLANYESEMIYSINLLLDLFHLDHFEKEEVELKVLPEIIEPMLDEAVKSGLIEDTITSRDLFDTRIMNCLTPRPSEVISQFNNLYHLGPTYATQYFYDLSRHTHYIREDRIEKNIAFHHYYKYGDIQITINLSKPEKDPKEIEKAKLIPASGYPKCLLCKENVGFAGHLNHPARQTHRIIPVTLSNHQYYLQYSPYVYYNEHCIVFNEDHIPMVINETTFQNLFEFVSQFPHYMLGSNADLPIVGGSILTHDHYQGGRHHFPIEDAEVFTTYFYKDTKVDLLYWPLSTIRLSSHNKKELITLSTSILNQWINYSDDALDIIAYTDNTRHNTITPIVRKNDDIYSIDLVLRNNRTTDEYPLGIFHPHAQHHHIKKENIGLIEVMGLAILPARLKEELELIKDALINHKDLDDSMNYHNEWFQYLKTQTYEDIDTFIEEEVAKKFVYVLEDAGVFKMDETGREGFVRFIESLKEYKEIVL